MKVPIRSWSGGYTLTELVMVLGIMGIIGMLSGVWLTTQLPHYYLNGAARQLRSDFLAARMNAVRQRNKFRIAFVDEHSYTILDDDNGNGSPDPGEWLESRDIQNDYHDVVIHSTNNPVFHPRGTASNLATVTLTNSAGEKALKVSITGRVTVITPSS